MIVPHLAKFSIEILLTIINIPGYIQGVLYVQYEHHPWQNASLRANFKLFSKWVYWYRWNGKQKPQTNNKVSAREMRWREDTNPACSQWLWHQKWYKEALKSHSWILQDNLHDFTTWTRWLYNLCNPKDKGGNPSCLHQKKEVKEGSTWFIDGW